MTIACAHTIFNFNPLVDACLKMFECKNGELYFERSKCTRLELAIVCGYFFQVRQALLLFT